jgi:hypothetical protein
MPSSQPASNSKILAVKPKLALQEGIDTDDLSLDKDSCVSRERKREMSSEDPDLIVLDIRPRKQRKGCARDIHNIPSSSPVIEKSPQNRKPNCPPTPSTLGRSSPRRDGFRLGSIQHAPKKSPEKHDVVSTEEIQELFSNSIRIPPLKAGRFKDQEQLAESNALAMSGYESSVLVPARKGLPHDLRPSPITKDKPFQREMKKSNSSPYFLKPTGNPRQPSCSLFPASMARVDVHQTVPDTGVAFTGQTKSMSIQSRMLKQKPEFVQILDDSTVSEDEDLQPDTCKKGKDLSGLVQRRTPRLEYYSKPGPMGAKQAPKAVSKHDTKTGDVACVDEAVHNSNHALNTKNKSITMLAENFSTADALQNYICLRKGSSLRPQPTVSHHFPAMKFPAQRTLSKTEKSEKPSASKNADSNLFIPPLSEPEFTIPSVLRYFVFSASFLKNRRLASRVQRLYPGAELIERDFTLHKPHNPRVQDSPDPTRHPADDMSDEADIIVSPGTGIILTTLQKIRQCSLPGQTVRLLVRERVARVAPRYEKLLILISEDHIRDYSGDESGNAESQIVDSDYKAVVDFIGFCSSLKQDTQALLVVGKEDQLAKWIVAMMVKYGVADPEVKLIPEETLWEIFLRRAGFNAFAAQAILAKLKDQRTATSTTTVMDSSLPAFVKMSVERRLEKFEKMFGGSSLLGRVGTCLDARWCG